MLLARDLTPPLCDSLLTRILQATTSLSKMSTLTRLLQASQTKRTILDLEKELRFFVDTYLVRRTASPV
jgi:hypothetical protein